MFGRFVTSLLCIALLGASRLPGSFTAPAGDRPAGPLGASPFNRIIPSGRIIVPAGVSVPVGMNSLGVAIAPDGRYAIVTNDDEREDAAVNGLDARVRGGYSLAVVDTATMRVVDVFQAESRRTFFLGIAAVRDPADSHRTLVLASEGPANAVRVFDLTASGKLQPENVDFRMPVAADAHFANRNHAFPGSLIVSRDRTRVYVVNNLSNTVTALDLPNRRVLNSAAVGFFPYGIAQAGSRLFVTDEGLMNYAALPIPAVAPAFAIAPYDAEKASALSVLSLDGGGDLAAQTSRGLSLDRAPDGATRVGGAHPSAIAVTRDARSAFVALTNLDRVATISLTASPRAISSIDLALFARAPFGTQPNALALSANGKVLYAALAGINAVAVIDARNPAHLRRLGLIPTGWYPTALSLSPDGRFLYVANAKGYGEDLHFAGASPSARAGDRVLQVDLDSNDVWSTLQKIDLRRVNVATSTRAALGYLRNPGHAAQNAVVPALGAGPSKAIKHVVLILEENKTYDSMLGDLRDASGKPYGDGDPSLVSFGENVTPNLHALAREFGVAVNEYADAEESDAGHQFAAGGIASDYTEKTLLVKGGRRPQVNKNEDPEDYPRAGYIFNSLMHARSSYRDYGDLVRLSGYDEGSAADPKTDDPNFAGAADQNAPTSGLGGLYSLDVPAPLALRDHVDLNYPGWNLRIRDVRRAQEFMRDYDSLVKANAVPQFTYIWLPADHGGRGPNIPALPEEVADGDRALGTIVDYLSHLSTWSSTAIFIMPDDAQSTRDHVSEHRSYAIVVSPYAKRHYIGHHHVSTVSILKTEEELLGLPALSLGDLLATDLSDFFGPALNAAPYTNLPVETQTASFEGNRIADLLLRTDQRAPDADVRRSARLIGLSRMADRLAMQRPALDESRYTARQDALYQAALRVVSSP